MPQASDFTIKDGANEDVLFSNVQPASGNLPALYFARAKGAFPAQQPVLGVSSHGKAGMTRVVKQTVKTPILQSDGAGGFKVVDFVFTDVSTTIPGTASSTDRDNHGAFLANSLGVPQILSAHEDGYAPN